MMIDGDSELHAAANFPPIRDCPRCGGRFVEAAIAPPGQRERAIYPRCRDCGQERTDLEIYES
jgi:hypothetical protein